MKFLIILTMTFIFAQSAKADVLSSCQSDCFESKQKCNARKMHTFNTCHQDLFACRASCESGKPQKTYGAAPIEISFVPILR